MYLNTGYLNHSHMDFKDKSRPLIVGSCGTYRLSRHPKLPTYRPKGRLDYQTAMGKAPVGIAKMAKKHGAKVIALAGAVIEGAQECNEQGIDAYFPILRQVVTLDEAMDPATARKDMVETTEQVMRLVAAVK